MLGSALWQRLASTHRLSVHKVVLSGYWFARLHIVLYEGRHADCHFRRFFLTFPWSIFVNKMKRREMTCKKWSDSIVMAVIPQCAVVNNSKSTRSSNWTSSFLPKIEINHHFLKNIPALLRCYTTPLSVIGWQCWSREMPHRCGNLRHLLSAFAQRAKKWIYEAFIHLIFSSLPQRYSKNYIH